MKKSRKLSIKKDTKKIKAIYKNGSKNYKI